MADRPGPVLVTGANSGIGLATTLLLARRGWETWGTVRSKAKAKGLSDAATAAKVDALVRPVVLDVSDDKAVVRRWSELPDFYAVVNNAGYSELGAVEDVTADQARKQLDVNLIAPAVVSSCALPTMRERGAGRIVMVSSMFGRAAIMPLNAWYHASKFGLEALSDVLRMEVAGFGVKVVIVEPGFFRTAIGSDTKARAERPGRRRLTVPSGVRAHRRLRPDDGAPGTATRCRRPRHRLGHRQRPPIAPLPRRRRCPRPRLHAPADPPGPHRRRHPPAHRARRTTQHLHLIPEIAGGDSTRKRTARSVLSPARFSTGVKRRTLDEDGESDRNPNLAPGSGKRRTHASSCSHLPAKNRGACCPERRSPPSVQRGPTAGMEGREG